MVEWLVLHTAVALVLAALALGLARLLRLGPATRHALWLLVLVKLLTPPLIHWQLPAIRVAAPAPEAVEPALPPAAPPSLRPPLADVVVDEAVPLPGAPVGVEVVPAMPQPVANVASAPVDPAPFPWSTALKLAAGLAWVGGAAAVALVQLSRLRRVRHVLAQARPAPPWLEKQVAALSAALGVRPPQVRVLDGLASPMVWGLGRARLLWPQGLEDGLTPEGVAAVLVHELAHLRRRDHWVGWLLLAGGCVWWWHPLFHLVRRRLAAEAELACDAWVVATLPGARRAYAEALIEVCQRGSWAAAAAPAWGAAGSRRDFERRLVMVMRECVPCRLSGRMLLGVGLLAVLALPAWTLGQAVAPPTPIGETPAVTPRAGAGDAPLAGIPDKPLNLPKTADPDRRLQELEKKVEALLRELKELRAGGQKPINTPPAGRFKTIVVPVTTYNAYVPVTTAPAVVALTRATYALPAAKAEALAKFLKEHVKSSVLEVSVVKDHLIVTTTPQDQQSIGQFVNLIQGKRSRGGWSVSPYNPGARK